MPLRVCRLQLVVAIDATLLVRQRGIDRPKHQLIVDGEKFRLGLGIGLRGERFNRFRGACIRWPRRDFPSLTTDPAQTKIIIWPCTLVEALDRVGAKRRRHWSCDTELRTRGGIIGDESIDQPERNDFLFALVLLKPIHAEMIKSVADCTGNTCAERQIQQQAAA